MSITLSRNATVNNKYIHIIITLNSCGLPPPIHAAKPPRITLDLKKEMYPKVHGQLILLCEGQSSGPAPVRPEL